MTVNRLNNGENEHPHSFLMFDSNIDYFGRVFGVAPSTIQKRRTSMLNWVHTPRSQLHTLSYTRVDTNQVNAHLNQHNGALFSNTVGVSSVEYAVLFELVFYPHSDYLDHINSFEFVLSRNNSTFEPPHVNTTRTVRDLLEPHSVPNFVHYSDADANGKYLPNRSKLF